MKKSIQSTEKSLTELFTVLSEKEILDIKKMMQIRGGDGEGSEGGSEPIIIIPPGV